jgi:hypothetical protein
MMPPEIGVTEMKKVYILALALATSLTPVAASATKPDRQISEASRTTNNESAQSQQREGNREGRREERRENRNDPYTNRNGDLNVRVDRNRDGNVDRRYDRNNNEVVDRRYDRDRDGRIYEGRRDDRRYGQNDRNDNYNQNDHHGRNDSYGRNDNYRRNDHYGRGDNYGRSHRDGWHQGWRNDNRYNWRDYRSRYGSHYRVGRYYSPYRGYGYNRFNIGFRIGSPFYSSRYWINDPYHYRLPPAYGSYRWVRYYDDVLLIDTRSGYVVDVIHNFFW